MKYTILVLLIIVLVSCCYGHQHDKKTLQQEIDNKTVDSSEIAYETEHKNRNITVIDLHNDSAQSITISENVTTDFLTIVCNNDSLIVQNCRGICNTHVYEKRFLKIVCQTFGGSDVANWLTFVFCVSQGKVCLALSIMSDQESEVDQIFTDQGYTIPTYYKEDYHVSVTVKASETNSYVALLDESREVISKSNPEENESWKENFELQFDAVKNMFYNTTCRLSDYYKIDNGLDTITERYIRQEVSCINLRERQYYFVDGEWYRVYSADNMLYK